METGRFFWFGISNRSVNRRCIEVAGKILRAQYEYLSSLNLELQKKNHWNWNSFDLKIEIEHLVFFVLNIFCWLCPRVNQWLDRFWGSPPSGHQRQWKRSWSQSSYVWVCKIQSEKIQTYFFLTSIVTTAGGPPFTLQNGFFEFLKKFNSSHTRAKFTWSLTEA